MNEEDEEQRKPIMFKKQNQPTQNRHNNKKLIKTKENIKDTENNKNKNKGKYQVQETKPKNKEQAP